MQIRKTANNTYYFRVFYEDPKTRELKRKYSSGFEGKKETTHACNEFLGSLQASCDSDNNDNQNLLFKDVVDDYYT